MNNTIKQSLLASPTALVSTAIKFLKIYFMPNWLIEMLAVIALSKRTQWAIIFGGLFFIAINLLGSYFLSDFELHGPAAGLTAVIKQKLAQQYDKAAWGTLL